MKPEIVTGWTAVFAVLVAADPLLSPLGLAESSAPISLLERRGSARTGSDQGMSSRSPGFAPRTAFSPRTEVSNHEKTSPGPVWLEGADRVITARLLLTQHGPEVHWSHYGPLESRG